MFGRTTDRIDSLESVSLRQKRMRCFITGATGFIGGRIARQLTEAGHEVIALVRDRKKADGIMDLGISITQGDITDKESMRSPMSGVDGVFHVAALYKIGMRDKSLLEKINVHGTRNVLDLMRELGITRGVYTSTLGVFSDTKGNVVDEEYKYDGPHLSEYDRTKWLAHYSVAEPMIKEGLPLMIVQPGVVYGPEDLSSIGTMFRQYIQKRLPILPGKTSFCWAHVDDVARGHILAMEKGRPGESYILSGPVYSLEQVFALAESITGIRPPKLRLRPGFMKAMSKLMGFIETYVPVPPMYSAESLRVTAGVTYLGNWEKAKRELGYSVRPLEEGLSETLMWFKGEM